MFKNTSTLLLFVDAGLKAISESPKFNELPDVLCMPEEEGMKLCRMFLGHSNNSPKLKARNKLKKKCYTERKLTISMFQEFTPCPNDKRKVMSEHLKSSQNSNRVTWNLNCNIKDTYHIK